MVNNVSQRDKWITVEELAEILARELSDHMFPSKNLPWSEGWLRLEILSIMLNHGIAGIVTLSEDSDG